MLKIILPEVEKFNEETSEFIYSPSIELQLEHSLISISKWESKWEKSFLATQDKTTEEALDYIRCMSNEDIPFDTIKNLSARNITDINNYINSPMTATKFFEDNKTGGSRETVTAELIYYWMITLNIPMECQYWHLNRLLTLIRVCNVKNSPPKKMSKQEILSRNAALNAARKKQLNTKG